MWVQRLLGLRQCSGPGKIRSMKPSIEKLFKYFKLESENGFDDSAVMGGLRKILYHWQMEARADGLSEGLIKAVSTRLRSYHRLTPQGREVMLKGLWKRVKHESNGPIPNIGEEVEKKRDVGLGEKQSVAEVSVSQPVPTSKRKEDAKSNQEQVVVVDVEEPELEGEPTALNAPITVISGIGPQNAQSLAKLELKTLGDVLYHFPRRYDDYSKLKTINRLEYGEEVTIIGSVQNVSMRLARNGELKIIEAIVSDGTAFIRANWFNQPWLVDKLRDAQIVLSGKIDQYLGRKVMNNPEWEPIERQHLHTNRIVPVYPLTARVTQRFLRRTIHKVVSYWAPRVQDPLPEKIRQAADLISLPLALKQVHFPDSWEVLDEARHRLAFDEIFLLQLGVLNQRWAWKKRTGRVFEVPLGWLQAQIDRLPFQLTNAQKQAVDDLRADLASGSPMSRLVQGDVGSGKTIVAALGIGMVVRQGSQSALMAPTSILAEQHYQSVLGLLAREEGLLKSEEIRLLIGSTPESEKAEIKAGLSSGHIKLVVGTHALLEEPVEFADLQFAIIDEQHRFGVNQRAILREKGDNPHLLVMTATPIPRSLALTIYGDLDLTVIDEMPPGRQVISTYVVYPMERERIYTFVRKQVQEGRQAFIIYPLVEESEQSEGKAAVDEHERLKAEVFPDLNLGLLHGRLKTDEKDDVMNRFRKGEYQILVSTSVVEVGVDIPNATVMVIEGANRFGLAQLHQFRGRVGRGVEKSYCILIPENEHAAENERLNAMVETNDGFKLAEVDLDQRGPGEFLGTRQSGFFELQMANITDVRLIEKARRFATKIFEEDPELQQREHQLLADSLERFWGEAQADIS